MHDWAGDPKTRCSTSEGVLAIGPCFTVRHWSVTQATVSLSSAESEAKAMRKGCIEALYAKHLLEHPASKPFKIEVWTDSSSAKAIVQRLGPGEEVQTTSAAGKDRSHLVEQSGYAGELCRCFDKTRSKSSTQQVRWNGGLHISWLRNCQVSVVHENDSSHDSRFVAGC